MEDNDFGACSELIFAPIDRNIPDDAVLLSSGFRIYLVCSNMVLIHLFLCPFFGLPSCLTSSYDLSSAQDRLFVFLIVYKFITFLAEERK